MMKINKQIKTATCLLVITILLLFLLPKGSPP